MLDFVKAITVAHTQLHTHTLTIREAHAPTMINRCVRMVTARSINARLPTTTRTNRIIKLKINIKLLKLIKIQKKQTIFAAATTASSAALTSIQFKRQRKCNDPPGNDRGDLKSEFPLNVKSAALVQTPPKSN